MHRAAMKNRPPSPRAPKTAISRGDPAFRFGAKPGKTLQTPLRFLGRGPRGKKKGGTPRGSPGGAGPDPPF